MPEVLAPLLLPGLLFIGFNVSLYILAFCAYYRMKGMERALWAIVSQLRAARMEKVPDVDPAATRRALEVADAGHTVHMSMFGR